jgi:hypothetical protein
LHATQSFASIFGGDDTNRKLLLVTSKLRLHLRLVKSRRSKAVKTMILAAAAVLALGVGPAAYAESEGENAAADMWQARNGNATVPATEWFAATPAQRELL